MEKTLPFIGGSLNWTDFAGINIHVVWVGNSSNDPPPPKKKQKHNEPNASLFLGLHTSHDSLQDYDTAREVLRGAISKGNPGDAIDDFQKMKVQRPQEKVTLAPL